MFRELPACILSVLYSTLAAKVASSFNSLLAAVAHLLQKNQAYETLSPSQRVGA